MHKQTWNGQTTSIIVKLTSRIFELQDRNSHQRYIENKKQNTILYYTMKERKLRLCILTCCQEENVHCLE